MTRNLSVSESDAKSHTSRASELAVLNDEECKRILSVVERDFKLRQKEYKRLDDIKKQIRQENERVEYLGGSKEFNNERCIRCYKAFRFLFNPKEPCSECKLYVCHDCATYTKETKEWACKSCLQLKELEALTFNWFYLQSSKKHKRCGSAKVIRELHKRERELGEIEEDDDDFGYGTLPTDDSGHIISYVAYDANIKRVLKEYGARLTVLVEKLQADLAERNTYNNHQSIKGKSKEGLKVHQQQLTNEIARVRVALSGPLRPVLQVLYALQSILVSVPVVATVSTFYVLILKRTSSSSKALKTILNYTGSNIKTNTTHERDLQNIIIHQTEEVLQTNLQQFHKTLTDPNSPINANNFDQLLAQTIFDKCVSKEIFQELPNVVDSSAPPPKPQRQTSNTSSSLTSLTKPSTSQPTWSNSSPQTSNGTWEIQSRNDNIRKIAISRNSTLNEEEDTEKEDNYEEERDQITNSRNKHQSNPTTDSIEFDNGLKLDLSSIDDETSDINVRRRSIDADFDAIKKSKERVGDWQTNFTLIEPKSPSHSGEDSSRATNRESVFLTIPISDKKDLSPRIGDKPLEDLADDDLYADDESSSYPIPINTTTINEHSQISDNESTTNRKLFPLPANLLLQNHSSGSFRRPSYTYESDNESITSSTPSLADMKPYIDEEKFRMDPNITDPKFLIRPKDTTIRSGETAKFKAKAYGTEPIDVFWFRFGTEDELVNDEKYQLSHDDTYHYLKIYSTNKEDEGAYLCVIANDKAQNVDMVKLSIKDNKRSFRPPSILQDFKDTDISEGSSLTLECKFDQGYPTSRVLWYKENTLIKPDGHYKLYYYGEGRHALHVDETTIEDDNGTFTCLALNTAGRVQITADVFVHEKEVIDRPRDSPTIKKQKRLSKEDIIENIPMISPSSSPIIRGSPHEDQEKDNAKRYMDKFKSDRANKLLENFQNLYETSVQSLEPDTSMPRHQIQQPFYLNRQPSIEEALDARPRSPIVPQPDKSKWNVQLPQLLNTTVGPDRQERDRSRRHTTNINLQQEQQQQPVESTQKKSMNPLSQSLNSNETAKNNNDRPPSPLVQQLKQKFDKMTERYMSTDPNTISSPLPIGKTKVHRVGNDDGDGACPLLPDQHYNWNDDDDDDIDDDEVASLTCRGLTSNNKERRSIKKPRPMLPVRPVTNSTDNELRSTSIESVNSNNRNQRGKSNSSRSTTAVVKQIIGGGGTLVYDSLTQNNTPLATTSLLPQHYYPNHHHHYEKQRKEHMHLKQTTQASKNNLTNTNKKLLTQNQTDFSSNTKKQNHFVNSDDDEINHPHYSISTKDSLNRSTSMSDNLSIPAKSNELSYDSSSSTPIGRKSVLARAELWDRRISTTENETSPIIKPYDIQQWSNEFEKIQNHS